MMNLIVLATLIGSASLSGVNSVPSDPLYLKFKVPEGTTISYATRYHIYYGNVHISFGGEESDKVKSADANQNISIVRSLQLDGYTNGPTTSAVIKFGPTGEIVDYQEGDWPIGCRNDELLGFYYPHLWVENGDTWSVDIEPKPKTGGAHFHGDFKVLAEEKMGGYDTVKVDGVLSEADDYGMTTHNVYWVNKADGSIVKETVDMKRVNYLSADEGSVKIEMTRSK